MSNKGDCRTAPTTLGLLKNYKFAMFVLNSSRPKACQASMSKHSTNYLTCLLCLYIILQSQTHHNWVFIYHIARGKLGQNLLTAAADYFATVAFMCFLKLQQLSQLVFILFPHMEWWNRFLFPHLKCRQASGADKSTKSLERMNKFDKIKLES